MIQFDRTSFSNLAEVMTHEWIETNGLGGYASSTITGLNARRYHGLLVAAIRPPVDRAVLLSKLEETLVIDGRRYDLSTNSYPGSVHPRGFELQTAFRIDPFPVFTFEVEGLVVEKSVFMVHGENTTVVEYTIAPQFDARAQIELEISPLLAFRDHHHLGHEDNRFDGEIGIGESRVSFKPFAHMPELRLAHNADRIEKTGHWYRNFELTIERERGFDFNEDLFNPCVLSFDLNDSNRARIVASLSVHSANEVDGLREREITRRREITEASGSDDEFVRQLHIAADQFIVARGEQKTVIAGYHWFSDWGRDTMIALPGLTLVTKRFDVARSILAEFARHVDRGMIPNRFPDSGETPEYNTVDATLWFFEAIRAYAEHSNDYDFVRDELYDVLVGIIDWHVRGTRFNIHVDDDGLLAAGEEGVQITWMDAKIGDWVVTPRIGKPVEIQALWYNALRVMEDFATRFDDPTRRDEFRTMAEHARASFGRLFWNGDTGCLFDVVDGELRDASIRPNQIFALSLHHSMIDTDRALSIVRVVERELLTPVGLRSLSPLDPAYRPRYEGDPLNRDSAYHQGTVWAWPTGAFIEAYLKAFGRSIETRAQATRWLTGFRTHLSEAGLGTISEIFDADPPHTPRGCIAQAWSVAEVLRALAVTHTA